MSAADRGAVALQELTSGTQGRGGHLGSSPQLAVGTSNLPQRTGWPPLSSEPEKKGTGLVSRKSHVSQVIHQEES